ncbi:MAG: zinc ribbon domain-containing protein [Roseiflexus sp.]|jgi:hypothetical protein|nr:zinc ribbon domain-containing protein [Roseiflexus sp.]
MNSLYIFATIGALIALIPGASFLLIILEAFLSYSIARRHNVPVLNGISIIGALITGSIVLKALASFLHVFLGIGQLANALVAFGFIVMFGNLVDQFFARQAANAAQPAHQPSSAPVRTLTMHDQPLLPSPQPQHPEPVLVDHALRLCPQCSQQVDADALFCGYCGVRMT